MIIDARFLYTSVFKKTKDLNGRERYTVCCLIDKNDRTSIEKLETAAYEAAEEKFGKTIANRITFYNDGDEKGRDELKNKFYFTANTDYPPEIIDEYGKQIAEFYDGCYGKINIKPFAYTTDRGIKGVGYSFNAIMKTDEGEKIQRKTAKDIFADYIKS